ncbi:MAG TPA: translation initiation factor IF-5A [Candidatus Thermoplasmatota archaeon]|nr:translation initiation factor IF-5A [Candidatus Thermoplasmatota archaeon]
MSVTQGEVRQLKEGRYLVVDEEPCKILSITTSKPGKHGAAKARIDVVGIFDGVKRSVTMPTSDKCKIPMIDKRNAQVINIREGIAQLMDNATYETFELPIPDELKGEIEVGKDTMYFEAMGRKMLGRS